MNSLLLTVTSLDKKRYKSDDPLPEVGGAAGKEGRIRHLYVLLL